jgi:uncharacterized membrane protein
MVWDWLVVAAFIVIVAWSAATLAGLVLKVSVRFVEWLNTHDSPRPNDRRNGR